MLDNLISSSYSYDPQRTLLRSLVSSSSYNQAGNRTLYSFKVKLPTAHFTHWEVSLKSNTKSQHDRVKFGNLDLTYFHVRC